MAEKSIKARIVSRHDSEANWNKATGFIPKSGEVIIYSPDSTYAYSRIKVGDGITAAANLPFANNEYIIIDVSEQLNTESGSSQLSGTLTSSQLAVIKANMSKTALDVGGILVNFINGTYDPSSNSGDVMYATNYLSGITTDSEGILVDPQGVTYVVSVNLGTGAIKASGGQLGFGVHMIPLDSTIDSTNTSGTLPEADLKVINAGYQNCLISLGGTIYRPFRLRDGNASYQMVYLGVKTYSVSVVEINLTTGAYTVQTESNPLTGINIITVLESGGMLSEPYLQKIKSSPQDCVLVIDGAATVLSLGRTEPNEAYYFTTSILANQYITIGVTINLETGSYRVTTENKSIVTELPTNYVTTNTTQTITGSKTFSSNIFVGDTDSEAIAINTNYVSTYTGGSKYNFTFPNKEGTIALTSDIPDTSTLISEHNSSSEAHADIRGLITDANSKASEAYQLSEDAKAIAEGRAKAVSFDTFAAMTEALTAASGSDYKVGDNIFIKAIDVPDYWISEVLPTNTGTYGHYEISPLETQKLDLSEYAKTANLTNGTITVKNADNASVASVANNASFATRANKDGNGNVIVDTYATKSEVEDCVTSSLPVLTQEQMDLLF